MKVRRVALTDLTESQAHKLRLLKAALEQVMGHEVQTMTLSYPDSGSPRLRVGVLRDAAGRLVARQPPQQPRPYRRRVLEDRLQALFWSIAVSVARTSLLKSRRVPLQPSAAGCPPSLNQRLKEVFQDSSTSRIRTVPGWSRPAVSRRAWPAVSA